MPYMVRPNIVRILTPITQLIKQDPYSLTPDMRLTAMDLIVAREIAQEATTFLFSSRQALALRPALRRFADAYEYRLPFASLIIQFNEPIAETEFFALERDDPLGIGMADIKARGLTPEGRQALHQLNLPADHVDRVLAMDEDAVLALLLDQRFDEEEGLLLNTAVVWFASGSVNRVAWFQGRDDIFEKMDPFALKPDPVNVQNKQTIKQLATAIIAYINAENIVLERQAVPDKVNRKRRKRGKAIIEPYYVCRVRGVKYADGEGEGMTASGQSVSYRFDVRGHFRKLPDGRLTWVRPHQRGLANELHRTKAYDVA